MNIEGFGVGDANKKLTGIESTSGCKIEMSRSKDQSLTFLITGKQADMLKAKRIVQDLIEQVTIDCEIEQQYHRTVMGAKGSKVQKITREHNVQVKFPDKAVENGGSVPQQEGDQQRSSNPNIIRITGKKGNCEAASQALLELVPIEAQVKYYS